MMISLVSASTSLRHRWNSVLAGFHHLVDVASNRYRPERHYMRGPGPKWHAKHERNQSLL
jgi:hypothetical protein